MKIRGSTQIIEGTVSLDRLAADVVTAIEGGVTSLTVVNNATVDASTGDVTLTNSLTPTYSTVYVTGATGTIRDLNFQTSGVARWIIRVNSNAESGSGAGSDFQVIRRDDAGAIIDSPIAIARSTGAITLTGAGAISLVGSTAITGSLSLSGSLTSTATNAAVELGSTTATGTPFIDFHSSGNAIDYDVRLIAGGGTASVGQGTLTVAAATLLANGSLTVRGGVTAQSATASTGYLTLNNGTVSNAGFLSFFGTNAVRHGYVGFGAGAPTADAGEIKYVSGTHAFSGAMTVTGNITMQTGKQVYYTDIGTTLGVKGGDVRFDTITGGNAAGVGNIGSQQVDAYNIKDGAIIASKLSLPAIASVIASGAGNNTANSFHRFAYTGNSYIDPQTSAQLSGLTPQSTATVITDPQAYQNYAIQIPSTIPNGTVGQSGPGITLPNGIYSITVFLRVSANTSSSNAATFTATTSTGTATITGSPAVAASALSTTAYMGYTFSATLAGGVTGLNIDTVSGGLVNVFVSHITGIPATATAAPYLSSVFSPNIIATAATISSVSASTLVAGTITSDDIYLGGSGHIYAGTKGGARVDLSAAGLHAYNASLVNTFALTNAGNLTLVGNVTATALNVSGATISGNATISGVLTVGSSTTGVLVGSQAGYYLQVLQASATTFSVSNTGVTVLGGFTVGSTALTAGAAGTALSLSTGATALSLGGGTFTVSQTGNATIGGTASITGTTSISSTGSLRVGSGANATVIEGTGDTFMGATAGPRGYVRLGANPGLTASLTGGSLAAGTYTYTQRLMNADGVVAGVTTNTVTTTGVSSRVTVEQNYILRGGSDWDTRVGTWEIYRQLNGTGNYTIVATGLTGDDGATFVDTGASVTTVASIATLNETRATLWHDSSGLGGLSRLYLDRTTVETYLVVNEGILSVQNEDKFSEVLTSETTTSATLTNLSTTGPDVLFQASASGRAHLSFTAWGSNAGSVGSLVVAPEIYNSTSGGTVGTVWLAGSDANGATDAGASQSASLTGFHTVTGLTAGNWYLVRLRYRTTSGTGTFLRRKLNVRCSL